MRCERCRDALPEYLEDMLRPSERTAVEAHLADCDACATELREWRTVRLAIEEAPLPGHAPAEPNWTAFETRVLAHVRDRSAARRPAWLDWLVPVGAMAAVSAILFFTGLQGVSFEPAPQPADVQVAMVASLDTEDELVMASEMDLGWDQPLTWSLETVVAQADSASLETLAVALADAAAWETWEPAAVEPSGLFADGTDWLSDLDVLDSAELDRFAERLESGALS